jgi:hypothetical protein
MAIKMLVSNQIGGFVMGDLSIPSIQDNVLSG